MTSCIEQGLITLILYYRYTNSRTDNIDLYQMQTQTLLVGIAVLDLKNKDLLEKFGAVLPGDIIRKLFLAGEIADLTAQITEFNDYTTQEKADKAVKNWFGPMAKCRRCTSCSGSTTCCRQGSWNWDTVNGRCCMPSSAMNWKNGKRKKLSPRIFIFPFKVSLVFFF